MTARVRHAIIAAGHRASDRYSATGRVYFRNKAAKIRIMFTLILYGCYFIIIITVVFLFGRSSVVYSVRE